MRLIDADALKTALKSNCKPELCHDYNTAWCEHCCPNNDFEDLIDNATTIIWCSETSDGLPLMDLRPRPQGEWIYDSDHSITIDMYKCPVCGCYGSTHFNYCQNCGARMKGGAEE